MLAWVLSLTSCGSWSPEDFQNAVEAYDAPAAALGPRANAAVHYKNLMRVLPTFPEAMQTMDEICRSGLPERHSHLANWVASCGELKARLAEIVQMDHYRLRHSDLDQRDRLDRFVQLNNLFLVDAALLESSGQLVEALRQTLRARRMVNHLVSDGSLQDVRVAHLIHFRCSQLTSRLIDKLDRETLHQALVEIEVSQRLYHEALDVSAALGRLARLRALEWLRPQPEDTVFERMALSSVGTLTAEVTDLLEEWSEIESLPLKDLIEGEEAEDLLRRLDGAHTFTQAYFGHRRMGTDGRRPPSGLVLVRLHMAAARVRDEMLQLRAAARLSWHHKKRWPDSIGKLTGEVEACHGTLGRAFLAKRPERPNPFVDPFSGKPYGLRLEGDRLILWSWGPDFSDDAGLEPWDGSIRGDLIEVVRP